MGELAGYIGTYLRRGLHSAIEPAAVTLATIYVMIWGDISKSTGRIQEPIWEGIRRIFISQSSSA